MIEIVGRVFAVNVVLAAPAATTVALPARTVQIAALIIGTTLVAWLLAAFACGTRIKR